MRGAERIIFALGALGEAAEAAALAQGADALAPASNNLVRIGLMADVPHQFVVRRVEHIMESDGQLDHAKAGTEVAPGHRNGVNHFLAEFIRQLPQLPGFQPAQIGRNVDLVEKRGFKRHENGSQSMNL